MNLKLFSLFLSIFVASLGYGSAINVNLASDQQVTNNYNNSLVINIVFGQPVVLNHDGSGLPNIDAAQLNREILAVLSKFLPMIKPGAGGCSTVPPTTLPPISGPVNAENLTPVVKHVLSQYLTPQQLALIKDLIQEFVSQILAIIQGQSTTAAVTSAPTVAATTATTASVTASATASVTASATASVTIAATTSAPPMSLIDKILAILKANLPADMYEQVAQVLPPLLQQNLPTLNILSQMMSQLPPGTAAACLNVLGDESVYPDLIQMVMGMIPQALLDKITASLPAPFNLILPMLKTNPQMVINMLKGMCMQPSYMSMMGQMLMAKLPADIKPILAAATADITPADMALLQQLLNMLMPNCPAAFNLLQAIIGTPSTPAPSSDSTDAPPTNAATDVFTSAPTVAATSSAAVTATATTSGPMSIIDQILALIKPHVTDAVYQQIEQLLPQIMAENLGTLDTITTLLGQVDASTADALLAALSDPSVYPALIKLIMAQIPPAMLNQVAASLPSPLNMIIPMLQTNPEMVIKMLQSMCLQPDMMAMMGQMLMAKLPADVKPMIAEASAGITPADMALLQQLINKLLPNCPAAFNLIQSILGISSTTSAPPTDASTDAPTDAQTTIAPTVAATSSAAVTSATTSGPMSLIDQILALIKPHLTDAMYQQVAQLLPTIVQQNLGTLNTITTLLDKVDAQTADALLAALSDPTVYPDLIKLIMGMIPPAMLNQLAAELPSPLNMILPMLQTNPEMVIKMLQSMCLQPDMMAMMGQMLMAKLPADIKPMIAEATAGITPADMALLQQLINKLLPNCPAAFSLIQTILGTSSTTTAPIDSSTAAPTVAATTAETASVTASVTVAATTSAPPMSLIDKILAILKANLPADMYAQVAQVLPPLLEQNLPTLNILSQMMSQLPSDTAAACLNVLGDESVYPELIQMVMGMIPQELLDKITAALPAPFNMILPMLKTNPQMVINMLKGMCLQPTYMSMIGQMLMAKLPADIQPMLAAATADITPEDMALLQKLLNLLMPNCPAAFNLLQAIIGSPATPAPTDAPTSASTDAPTTTSPTVAATSTTVSQGDSTTEAWIPDKTKTLLAPIVQIFQPICTDNAKIYQMVKAVAGVLSPDVVDQLDERLRNATPEQMQELKDFAASLLPNCPAVSAYIDMMWNARYGAGSTTVSSINQSTAGQSTAGQSTASVAASVSASAGVTATVAAGSSSASTQSVAASSAASSSVAPATTVAAATTTKAAATTTKAATTTAAPTTTTQKATTTTPLPSRIQQFADSLAATYFLSPDKKQQVLALLTQLAQINSSGQGIKNIPVSQFRTMITPVTKLIPGLNLNNVNDAGVQSWQADADKVIQGLTNNSMSVAQAQTIFSTGLAGLFMQSMMPTMSFTLPTFAPITFATLPTWAPITFGTLPTLAPFTMPKIATFAPITFATMAPIKWGR